MKYFNMSVCVIVLLCIMAGCGINKEELYAQWEQENREAWEKAAYEEGYDARSQEYEDNEAIIEEREADEEKLKQERLDEAQKREEQIQKICKENQCQIWSEDIMDDFTADIQKNAVGNKFLLEFGSWFDVEDSFYDNGTLILKASSIHDIFYIKITEEQYEQLRPIFEEYKELVIVVTVEEITPVSALQAYVSDYSVLDEDDSYVERDSIYTDIYIDTGYRIVTGVCEEITPLD